MPAPTPRDAPAPRDPALREAIESLAAMPAALEALYRSFPAGAALWKPRSWEGIPGETFSALEQLCHLRDIELDGYQVRIRRLLDEERPLLVSLDGYALARERSYATSNAVEALAAFQAARAQTLASLAQVGESHWARSGVFEGYGRVTLASVVHYLASHDQQHLACLRWLLGKYAAET